MSTMNDGGAESDSCMPGHVMQMAVIATASLSNLPGALNALIFLKNAKDVSMTGEQFYRSSHVLINLNSKHLSRSCAPLKQGNA